MAIRLKRVHDRPARSDGLRLLVDRVWPRGVSKAEARVDEWLRDVAPSTALRKWFGHDPERWEGFLERYFAELDRSPEAVSAVAEPAREGRVTLLFGARDREHNNAVALRAYLRERFGL